MTSIYTSISPCRCPFRVLDCYLRLRPPVSVVLLHTCHYLDMRVRSAPDRQGRESNRHSFPLKVGHSIPCFVFVVSSNVSIIVFFLVRVKGTHTLLNHQGNCSRRQYLKYVNRYERERPMNTPSLSFFLVAKQTNDPVY